MSAVHESAALSLGCRGSALPVGPRTARRLDPDAMLPLAHLPAHGIDWTRPYTDMIGADLCLNDFCFERNRALIGTGSSDVLHTRLSKWLHAKPAGAF
jgi:hypothetical protein